ncbi:hypothetical protein O6H91_Y095900 [Diphasiastrum complanatum]|nr:hypothetical protein O6H91_Y095900 [Diphasiastrum complanatum]
MGSLFPPVLLVIMCIVTSYFICILLRILAFTDVAFAAGDPLYVAGGIPSTTAESTLGMLHYETCAEDGGHNKPITPLPGDCGYHLHSHRLTFDHPITSKKMNIIAPPPAALLAQHEKKHMLTIFASKMDDWSSAQQRGLVLS